MNIFDYLFGMHKNYEESRKESIPVKYTASHQPCCVETGLYSDYVLSVDYIILTEQVQFLPSNLLTNQMPRRDITPDCLAAHWRLCSKTMTEQPIGSVSRSDDVREPERFSLPCRHRRGRWCIPATHHWMGSISQGPRLRKIATERVKQDGHPKVTGTPGGDLQPG